MTGPIVVMNPNLERQLAASAPVRMAQRKAAEAARREAERLAPRDTGDYASSFAIEARPAAGGGTEVSVVNTDGGAAAIEFGARQGRNPRFRTLGQAAEAMRGR